MRAGALAIFAIAVGLLVAGSVSAQSSDFVPNQKSPAIDLGRLTKQANEGNAEAQFRLGLAYEFGQGVEKSAYDAMRWYRMAADRGDLSAENNLCHLYQTGPEGIKDLREAAKWYTRAAVYGSPDDQYNIGQLYIRGDGCAEGCARGRSLDSQGCGCRLS